MGRYRFRKMYFICEKNTVIAEEYEMTNAYRRKEYADSVCKSQNGIGRFEYEKNLPPRPIKKVEAFYLVPEKLFDEVLQRHCKHKADGTPISPDEVVNRG